MDFFCKIKLNSIKCQSLATYVLNKLSVQKTVMKVLFFSLILVLLTLGCHKNKSNITSNESFPNKVGDTWHYLVYDTTLVYNDTTAFSQYNLDVSIVADTTLPGGGTATVWKYQYPGHADTSFVIQSGDTIRFLYNANNLSLIRQYIIPFSVNSSWAYSYCDINKVKVIERTAIQVGQTNFLNSFHLFGSAGCPDGIFGVDEWFADNIGLVKSYYNPFGELIITKHIISWLLVSYSLK
jgi:hypothetical protein